MTYSGQPKCFPFKGFNEKNEWLGDVFLKNEGIVTARSVSLKVKHGQRISLTDCINEIFAYGKVVSVEQFRFDDFVRAIAPQRCKEAGFRTAAGWVKAFVKLHRNRTPERVQVIVIQKVG